MFDGNLIDDRQVSVDRSFVNEANVLRDEFNRVKSENEELKIFKEMFGLLVNELLAEGELLTLTHHVESNKKFLDAFEKIQNENTSYPKYEVQFKQTVFVEK